MKLASDEPAVADHYVDVSDSISKSHSAYWDSRSVYEVIARHW